MSNEDILSAGSKKTSGKYDFENMPRVSFGALVALQKIDSPFTRQPQLDAEGNPIEVEIVPSLEEVAKTFYILLNQGNPPRLATMLADPTAFDNAVLDMSLQLMPEDLPRLVVHLNAEMKRLNTAMTSNGFTGERGGNLPAGPSPS